MGHLKIIAAMSPKMIIKYWDYHFWWCPPFNFGLIFFKSASLYLWVDTRNLKIVAESSISLVSKTNCNFFPVRFSCHPGQVFVSFFENLIGLAWKPNLKKLKVVLGTRDIEDSSTMFRFPLSTHKKVMRFWKI